MFKILNNMKKKQNYVIEVELPDGFHWFVGIGNHPLAEKKGVLMPMNCWSPYPEEALLMDDETKAIQVNDNLLQDVKGKVLTQEEASFHLGYSKLEDGNFLAPRRIRSLQVGERFVKRYPGLTYKVIKRTEKQIVCKAIDVEKYLRLPFDSTKFCYVILKPVKQQLDENKN